MCLVPVEKVTLSLVVEEPKLAWVDSDHESLRLLSCETLKTTIRGDIVLS